MVGYGAKAIARFQGAVVPVSEVPRIQDAANQAAAKPDQLMGLLLADLGAQQTKRSKLHRSKPWLGFEPIVAICRLEAQR